MKNDSIQGLKDRHRGEAAWIVGKGPSLVMLSQHHIGDGPVIAINEAIIAVESLGLENAVYSMQKDADGYTPIPDAGRAPSWTPIADSSSFIPIRNATLLVHRLESPNRLPEYRPRYVFDAVEDFGLEWWSFSSLVSVAVARLMGCTKVVFVSLDGCAFGDYRTCTPRPDGSYDVMAVDGYAEHRYRLDDYLARAAMPAEWLTPTNLRPRAPESPSTESAHREIERLQHGVNEHRHARISLEAALQEAQGFVAHLQARSDELLECSQTLQAELAVSREHDSGLQTELTASREQICGLQAELNAAAARIAELERSWSWRVTAPMRTVLGWLTRR